MSNTFQTDLSKEITKLPIFITTLITIRIKRKKCLQLKPALAQNKSGKGKIELASSPSLTLECLYIKNHNETSVQENRLTGKDHTAIKT